MEFCLGSCELWIWFLRTFDNIRTLWTLVPCDESAEPLSENNLNLHIQPSSPICVLLYMYIYVTPPPGTYLLVASPVNELPI